jgi:pimeloyl-ACP methyl ester carboxylesterase
VRAKAVLVYRHFACSIRIAGRAAHYRRGGRARRRLFRSTAGAEPRRWALAAAVGCVTRTQRHAEATKMAEIPTLYVCHGDDGGPRIHPCRRVQEALRDADIEYEKVVAAHGSPFPFMRKGSREQLREATGETKLPTLKLADGTVLAPSKKIFAWIAQQRSAA